MKIRAIATLDITYDAHEDESFDPEKQLRHCLRYLFNLGLLTGDSSAVIDSHSIAISIHDLTEIDVDFLVAYGDGTWERKLHKVLLNLKDLRDATGAIDLRKLDPCIDKLLEETYYDADVVAMVPYFVHISPDAGVDASSGTPTFTISKE